MKYAISTDSSMVSQHFGRCPEFTIVEIEENEVKDKEIIKNPGHKPGYLPKFLNNRGVDCIISGGMGRRAISHFDKFDIKAVTGLKGSVDKLIEKIKEGKLKSNKNPCEPGKGKDYGLEKED